MSTRAATLPLVSDSSRSRVTVTVLPGPAASGRNRASGTAPTRGGAVRRAALAAGLALAALLGAAALAEAACSLTTGDFDGNGSTDLRILGDAADQTLRIQDDPDAGTTTVFLDCNGDGDFLNAAAGDINGSVLGEFELFDLRLGNGNDTVLIEVPQKARYVDTNRNFVVQLGGGQNAIRFIHPSLSRLEYTAERSRLAIEVQGGGAADDVQIALKGAIASLIVARVDVGGGNDTVRFGTTEEVRYEQASVVDVSIEGDAGDDHVTYNPTADLFDGSVYRVNIAGGAGADTVDGGVSVLVSDGQLHLTADLGTGNDVLSWRPPVLIGVAGRVHIGIIGGAGNDNIKIDGAGAGETCTVAGLLALTVHGDDGNDAITANLSPPTACEVDGTVRVHLDGGSGNDAVVLGQISNAASTGQYDFLLRGGLGTDTLLLAFDNAGISTPAAYTPVGAALLDGGFGTDECTVAGTPAPLAHLVSCE